MASTTKKDRLDQLPGHQTVHDTHNPEGGAMSAPTLPDQTPTSSDPAPAPAKEGIFAGPGRVHVIMTLSDFEPTEVEPNSRPGVFDEYLAPDAARDWANCGSDDFSDALLKAADVAEEMLEHQPWCDDETRHEFDYVPDATWHIHPIGLIQTTGNDLAHGDEPNAPFVLEVTRHSDDDESHVVLAVDGEAETATMTLEQARHARDLFTRAVELLEQGGGRG